MAWRKRAALGAAGSLLLAGVASAGQAVVLTPSYPKYTKHVTITWWSWTQNADNVVAAFEKAYPTIKVIHRNVGAGQNEYTKLLTVIKAGTGGPDVVQIEYQMLPEFIATGGLTNLTPLGADRYRKYFIPWTWKQVSQGNAVYAIPEDTGPMVLFYRPDIFKKYGLVVPKTWDQFAQDALKLHQENPNMYFSFFSPQDGGMFLGLAWAAGARPFHRINANTWKVDIDSPQMEQVANLYGRLIKAGAVQVIADWSAGWIKNIADGKYAAIPGAVWSASYEIGAYLKGPSDWHVAPLPQWQAGGPFVSGNWGGSTNAVLTQSKHKRAALLFAAWINTSRPGLDLAVTDGTKGGRGLWPADLYGLNDPIVYQPQASMANQRTAGIYIQASKAVDTSFEWSPWTIYLYNVMGVEFTKAAAGKESWQQALKNIQQQVVQFAEQQGYTIQQ